jgi:CubicO group peptidase (beta-lactamase class C family)
MVREHDSGAVWRRNAIAGLMILGLLIAACIWRPDRAMRVAVGVTAHDLCHAVFITGRSPDVAFREMLAPRPGYRLVAPLITYTLDRDKLTVQARLGGIRRNAIFTPGRGCLLSVGGGHPAPPLTPQPASLALLPDIAGPEVVVPRAPELAHAMDRLFAEETPTDPRRVKAVVVLQHGRIIAERYAEGYGVTVPVNGWSMSKSLLNAMLGVLVRDGRLRMDAVAPIPLWRRPGDPRGAITLDNLARMTSGLAVDQDSSGFDAASQILYDEHDTVGASVRRPMARAPGREWRYSDPQTLILARVVQNAAGGTPEGFLRLARREVLEPLGMTGVTIDVDGAGNPLISTYVAAPARSWARLGQLYLHDGRIGNVRILPPGWVDYSRRVTLQSPYGAGFWVVDTPDEDFSSLQQAGLPRDTFVASGNLGQRIYIMPSQDMVVVRLGLTMRRGFGARQDAEFIRSVIAAQAVPSSQPTGK